MKKIELIWPTKVVCPFCNQLIQTIDEVEGFSEYKLCEHVIYLAHDEGFEFRSDEVNKQLKIDPKEQNMDIEFPDEVSGYDDWTDLVKIEGGIKVAAYDDCTNPEGIYFGFKP